MLNLPNEVPVHHGRAPKSNPSLPVAERVAQPSQRGAHPPWMRTKVQLNREARAINLYNHPPSEVLFNPLFITLEPITASI
jgi:hypothetical protein